jgi:hypothetical protein
MTQIFRRANIQDEMVIYHTRARDAALRYREIVARTHREKSEYWARANEHAQMVKFWVDVVLTDE